jgi:diguanylate cyclase (GGDEF)-like protein/PAS domain S-box-containing protein
MITSHRVWPRRATLGFLAGTAVLAGVLQLLRPDWDGRSGPALLALATVAVALPVLRHSRRIDPVATATWRGFAAIAGLLALGHLIRALGDVGVNPSAAGLADLPLAATGPVAALICVRLVRSTGGRIRMQTVLDAAVALTALGVLLEMLVPLTVGTTDGSAQLLTVGYPAVSALLCAAGLVTFAGVSAPRRAAAAWLLLTFASLAVVMVSGALAVGRPSPVLDVVASTAYLAMLASATQALSIDPGPRARTDRPTSAVPLAGVVVSYCLGFGVLLLLLGGLAFGRPLVSLQSATAAGLMILTFARTLVWARDGARLTRQVLRTEAFFRTLVHRSADVTIVLDDRGQVTWASTQTPSGWSPRDLEGRQLRDLVHEDDRHELYLALHPAADDGDARGPVFRLRGRDGSWRQFESVRTALPAGVPGGDVRGPGRRTDAGRDGVVLHLRDVAGRRSSELELERLAYTDYLTGLPNRARLMAALAAARARVAAGGTPACLLLLDLDGFKPVNDVAGHEAGDQVLVEVAARLRATVRDGDLVGRLGGDEFAVLVSEGIGEATALAERIVAELRTLHPARSGQGPNAGLMTTGLPAPGVVFDVSGSVGVTELDPADDVSTTVRQADLALRAAKAAGKSCVRTAGHAIDSAAGRRTRLARDLRAALEQEQFRVVYQPVVGVAERRILGLEALVRWDHPVLGTVPPDEFISLAEDDGLIVTLQRWVLQRATTDAAALLAVGWDVQMGVNVSVRHLQAGCLAPDVATALAESGLPPRKLILEITESVMLDAEDRLESDLATLHEMGCILSVDDFGRGYSSLAYLARLPVDILKMDREFIADIERDERGAAIVSSVIDMGRRLGMDVVAEGVESIGQMHILQDMRCAFLQGWLFGRPVDLAELTRTLATFDPAVLDPARVLEMDSGVHTVGQAG